MLLLLLFREKESKENYSKVTQVEKCTQKKDRKINKGKRAGIHYHDFQFKKRINFFSNSFVCLHSIPSFQNEVNNPIDERDNKSIAI